MSSSEDETKFGGKIYIQTAVDTADEKKLDHLLDDVDEDFSDTLVQKVLDLDAIDHDAAVKTAKTMYYVEAESGYGEAGWERATVKLLRRSVKLAS